MNFDDTPQEAAFRSEAKAWIAANAPKQYEEDLRKSSLGRTQLKGANILEVAKAWQKKKADAGWACLHWPKEYGGRGATPIERVIWQQEEGAFGKLSGMFIIGHGMCGPTMMAFAGEDQKRKYLPPLASGEKIWCQLFSEPAGGSDVAGLRTRAEKKGDDWIINGQKIWTSGAHYSDYGILLTRTDPNVAKHKGLTMFFLDMKSPGVEIKPIKQANGQSDFNEVYFTDVRIPDAQRLGEVNDGWNVSLTTLMNERMSIGAGVATGFPELFEFCSNLMLEDGLAIDDRGVRSKLAHWAVRASGLKYTSMRAISALSKGERPGPENSIGKLVAGSMVQDVAAYALDLQGAAGVLSGPEDAEAAGKFQAMLLRAPGTRVEGGTDEIMRNIIAERVLGLPGDIRVDKDVPFNKIPTKGSLAMNFDDTPQEAAFRAEARQWVDANAPKQYEAELSKASLGRIRLQKEEIVDVGKAWQKKKADAGWACLHWPREYGGRGATPIERVIWQQEEGVYGKLTQPFQIGEGMCGPTVMAYGSEEHKRHYLPKLASGEQIWCQLFSEPAGGSDVAGLRTRAEKKGDNWIVNGQKIWTSGAHYSDYGLLITRTDPNVPKHKGLTMFFLDMKSPGVEVRPIKQANGMQEFNEVYFTDVVIPDSQRLGAVGDGWNVSLTTLMNERMSIGARLATGFPEMFDFCSNLMTEDGLAIDDRATRSKLASWAVKASGLKYTSYRAISALSKGERPGPENSIGKLVAGSMLQDIAMHAMDLEGAAGVFTGAAEEQASGQFQQMLLSSPSMRIAGGTDEILRNIIAERVLGLPGDIRVDKDVPFNKIPTKGR